jgi:large-conductance mechanosensitive channel
MENTFKTPNHFSNPTIFKEEFKKFIVDNGVVGTTAGVSIALVTKDVIQSFVGDIILPSFYFILASLNIPKVTKMLPGKHFIDLTNFMKQIISWILVIIITYLFITITFKSLLGIGTEPVKERDVVKKEGFFGGVIQF